LMTFSFKVTCKLQKRDADEEIVSIADDADSVDVEWDWDAGVPHYPHPRFNDNGDVLFFPRIIGGTPAVHGEFQAKISLQTRRGDHFCGGALIGKNFIFFFLQFPLSLNHA
jgi:Trypsin